MDIVSFAKTKKEFRAGIKTETRRLWQDKHAARFTVGKIFQAYDKSPRSGGKCIGYGQVTKKPYKQWLHDMPKESLVAEGGRWKTVDEFMKEFDGDCEPWVLTFKKIQHPQQTTMCPECGEVGAAQDTDDKVVVYECSKHHNWTV